MKSTLILIALMLNSIVSNSQDLIIKRTGEDINSKVLEISNNEVKFKKWENLDGPIISIPKNEILMIRYQNGTKDIFNDEIKNKSNANINNKLALGLQYQTLTFGASIKYQIDRHSVIQASFNPISVDVTNLNYYGGRYYYLFPQDSPRFTPYLFAGAGLVTYNSKSYNYNYSGSFFGYNAGGGFEGRVVDNLALSLDAGYGKLNFSGFYTVIGLNLGFGIHYYIK